MTLAEILTNEELRRHEFPVASEKIFLAHAGVCPLPRRVAEAIRAYASQCTLGDQETLLPAYHQQHSRELAARLLQARPDEIAFVGPTSLALSFISGGLKFEPGDNVLVYREDYPSNVYPWMSLAARGVKVRFLQVRELGRIQPSEVMDQVDEHTRLVALASCHFVAGYRLDLGAIGEALRKRNILFCVDAIQTLGAFPISVEQVDFLAADAHKWLLGPCAAGILFVRKALQEMLQPTAYGWNNVRCPNYVAQETMTFRPDARRYEAGTHNLLGLVGLNAALELLLEIGLDPIAAELLRKRAWLVPALRDKGYAVLQADAPSKNASGIIAFFRPGADLAALHEKLESASIITSLRADRSGQRYIRISPHFYNTDAELDRLLKLL
ncbi:MAG: aminotransferase class V-fold PLP-dependent enzyme [Verrucomicrobia bacterium]|nr:aminotransferase class V-fold PLP-dependent enzyme [Verrucomicrobiota bacterium]